MIIDLSHTLSSNTPVYPGDAETIIDRVKTFDIDGYTISTASFSPHTGTHIDMPSHLTADGRMVPDFPAESFVARGVLLDVRKSDVIDFNPLWEDKIQEYDAVLLYTGCSEHYGQDRYFTEHPVVSERLADYLVEKRISILGIDAPSPDRVPHTIHRKLMNSGVFILENLTNLGTLFGIKNFTLIALPVKLDAEAAPVRAAALIGPRAENPDSYSAFIH